MTIMLIIIWEHNIEFDNVITAPVKQDLEMPILLLCGKTQKKPKYLRILICVMHIHHTLN